MKLHQLNSIPLSRLKQRLRKMRRQRILVIGDVGLDRYIVGLVERISPEAPVPIVLVQTEELKLGLAANVANNIRALGGFPRLVGVVGRDENAKTLRHLLKSQKIATRWLVEDSTRRTVLKDRIVSDKQQLLRIDFESSEPIRRVIQEKICQQIESLFSEVDGIVIEDYAKGLLSREMIQWVLQEAHRAGKWVMIDPNVHTPCEFYQGALLLTPNTKEAQVLSGISIVDDASLIRAGEKLIQTLGLRYLAVTRGKDGIALFTAQSKDVILVPTLAREVYDVSGAGDTVIAVLSLAFASGASLEEAAFIGNLAAGIEVEKKGTAIVSPQEILDRISN